MSQLRDSSDGDNAGSKKKAVHQNRKRIGTLTGASWSWRIVGCTSPPQNLFPFPLRLGPIVLAYSSGTSPHLAKQMSRLSNMNPGDDLSQGLEKQACAHPAQYDSSTLPGGNPCGSPDPASNLDGAHVQRGQLKNATSKNGTVTEDIASVAE
ncbi:hypothetical protein CFAM422_004590 [Trichoderma lentiforme]|uniref:Uncharacterized protein n=1 Tax=Trichoderma lentiforme TaxID=1567552 RepID=A0A9P5CFN9_9HYPO|nr:hypothetical protein CFAM422_004590 [Trichoderma lentiforme]